MGIMWHLKGTGFTKLNVLGVKSFFIVNKLNMEYILFFKMKQTLDKNT